jgi:hypothetical protein
MSHSSQALYFLIESIALLIEPRRPGLWIIGTAQLLECFADRKFRCISHSEPHRLFYLAIGNRFSVSNLRDEDRASAPDCSSSVMVRLRVSILMPR